MELMEENNESGYEEELEEVEEVKKKTGMNTTEALLLMIYQTVDQIRFHQS